MLKIIGILALVSTVSQASESMSKDFEYFEDVLGRFCSCHPKHAEPALDRFSEVGDKIYERRKSIVSFIGRDADKLSLNNLSDFDAWPLAEGIMRRALREDIRKLEEIDLTGNDRITGVTTNLLFVELVNHGVCDKLTLLPDGTTNNLKGLKIRLPNNARSDILRADIAAGYEITFEFSEEGE